jgi:hypothetical protein
LFVVRRPREGYREFGDALEPETVRMGGTTIARRRNPGERPGSFRPTWRTARLVPGGIGDLDAVYSNVSVTAVRALVSCPTANLRYSTSGATPTSSTWHKLTAGDALEIDVDPRKFKFIAEVAGPSTVYVDYHGIG